MTDATPMELGRFAVCCAINISLLAELELASFPASH